MDIETNQANVSDKFDSNFDNLRQDINTIDLMLSSLHKHILVLESQQTSIENAIKTANQTGADKTKLYGILNRIQDLLSRYYDNYNRFSETKYKYRKEQNELNFKVTRLLEIELRELNKGTNANELNELLKSLHYKKNSQPSELEHELDELQNDPLYEI
jgi:MinD-like ATPase involved in chromosome partitioning or flagellar assembly